MQNEFKRTSEYRLMKNKIKRYKRMKAFEKRYVKEKFNQWKKFNKFLGCEYPDHYFCIDLSHIRKYFGLYSLFVENGSY